MKLGQQIGNLKIRMDETFWIGKFKEYLERSFEVYSSKYPKEK